MQFIKFNKKVFAFHEPATFDLASYMVANMDFVQVSQSQVLITCNQTFSSKSLTVNMQGIPMMDLRTNLDTVALWKLANEVKMFKG